MWLLDHNLPRHIIPILESYSIKCESTKTRGWTRLRNGELVAAASASGFTCILTRDGLFQRDATKALKNNPTFAIVFLTFPQMPGKKFAESFKASWQETAIVPVPGQLIHWPPR